MKILALDTSTEYCSVALRMDGETDARDELAGQRHSELVLGMIDELLAARHLSVRDLDGIAFGEGPGSFTGLRIACGVVQGLAFGADLPVVGVGTLVAMAESSGTDHVLCCVDARVQEIYHAAYVLEHGAWRALCEPSICAPTAAPEIRGYGWLGCGSGFKTYGDVLERRYGDRLGFVKPDIYPRAAAIAKLAQPAFEAGRTVSAEHAAPVYLRDKVALRIDERPNR